MNQSIININFCPNFSDLPIDFHKDALLFDRVIEYFDIESYCRFSFKSCYVQNFTMKTRKFAYLIRVYNVLALFGKQFLFQNIFTKLELTVSRFFHGNK